MNAVADVSTMTTGGSVVTFTTDKKGLSIYSAEALACVQQYGTIIAKSGLFGTRVPEQGQAIVLMAMSDGVAITRYREKFHVMGVQLALRAEWMLAEFRKLGGKFRWIDQGDDGQKATIEATFAGETTQVTFTIDDAKKAGLVKKDSGWDKNPGSMLRARVQSKMVRMLAPEVVCGYYTEEELEGVESAQPNAVSLTVGSMPSAPLQPNLSESQTTKVSQISMPPTETVTTSTLTLATTEQLAEFDALITELGIPADKQAANLAAAGVDHPSKLTTEKIGEFLTALRAKKASLSPSKTTETGTSSININGPLSQELESKLRKTITEVAQTPGGAEVTLACRQHLEKHGKMLADLTHGEAMKLLAALEQKQVALFLDLALTSQKKE